MLVIVTVAEPSSFNTMLSSSYLPPIIALTMEPAILPLLPPSAVLFTFTFNVTVSPAIADSGTVITKVVSYLSTLIV